MNFLKLIPVILSFLLLAAHFYRAAFFPVAAISLILPILLFIKQSWVARVSQIFLVLGTLEWVRTILRFVEIRQEVGMPWTRLAVILGIVALITGLSALIFQSKSLKERYSST